MHTAVDRCPVDRCFPLAGGGSVSARVGLPTETLKLPDCYSGVPQVARFRLTNTGDQPLLLELMPTGCDACVQRTLSRDRVPPGNTADVVLRFTPEGPMQAVALLKTNDPQRPVVRLTASVKARPFAAIDPACVHVGALDAQARTSVIVHIRPASGVSVRRLQARSDGSCVQPHVETARDGVIP